MILAADTTGIAWVEILVTLLSALVTIGLPAYLRIRKGEKRGDVLSDALDQSVAMLAKDGKVDDAKSVQGIARLAIAGAGSAVKAYNDARLEKTRTASPLDLTAIMAEAERRRAAAEGGSANRESEGDR